MQRFYVEGTSNPQICVVKRYLPGNSTEVGLRLLIPPQTKCLEVKGFILIQVLQHNKIFLCFVVLPNRKLLQTGCSWEFLLQLDCPLQEGCITSLGHDRRLCSGSRSLQMELEKTCIIIQYMHAVVVENERSRVHK